MAPAKIDVVIPLYNGARWIQAALDSIFQQKAKIGKIIVVDDGSTDASREIVARNSKVTLLQNPKRGAALARNFGAKFTTTPFIAFLDQDDIWHREHLRLLSEALINHPDVDMVTSRCKPFRDGTTPQFDLSDCSVDYMNPWDTYPSHGLACSPSFNLFRRVAFLNIGGWPVSHCGCADYSMRLRMSIIRPTVRIRAKTVAYRKHHESRFIVIRKHNPYKYLNFTLKVDDDLMEFYVNSDVGAGEKDKIRKRNQIAHYLNNLVHAFINKDDKLFSKAIHRLEDNINCESSYYRKCVFRHFYSLLSGCFTPGSNSKEMRNYSIELMEKWPVDAYLTQRAIWDVIVDDRPGLDFYVEYFLKRSWEFRKVFFMGPIIKRKIITPNEQYA